MSPIEHAPTETNGSIAAPRYQRPLCRLYLDAGLFFSSTCAKILDVPSNTFHFIGGTVAAVSRQGGHPHEPLAILGAM